MALLDIRQRTGWLFTAVVLAQLVLISAQVTTRTGVPMLEVAVFGAVAEIQRVATGVISGTSDRWQQYVLLQDVRGKTSSCAPSWEPCSSSCSRSGPWPRRPARSRRCST